MDCVTLWASCAASFPVPSHTSPWMTQLWRWTVSCIRKIGETGYVCKEKRVSAAVTTLEPTHVQTCDEPFASLTLFLSFCCCYARVYVRAKRHHDLAAAACDITNDTCTHRPTDCAQPQRKAVCTLGTFAFVYTPFALAHLSCVFVL